VYSDTASSAVTFKKLTEEQIRDYVDSGEPMDKAGAYGIQGLGGSLVEKYEGDFDTIVGLSLCLTEELIRKALEDIGE
jgi:septum formation protein